MRFDWALFAALSLPAIIVAARLTTGPSLSPDSIYYLYAARNFFDAAGLVDYDGSALTIFPPFYPFLIALVNVLTQSLEGGAAIIAVVSMACSSGIAYALLRRLDFQRHTALLLVLLTFLHPQMQMVYWYALSDAPYILIAALVLLILMRTRPDNIHAAALLVGILAGLGFLTRYAGVVLLPTAIIGMMCITDASVRDRLWAGAATALTGGVIVVFWTLRNYLADGTAFGPRFESVDTLLTTATHLASTVGICMVPPARFASHAAYIGFFGLAVSAALVLVGYRDIFRNKQWLLPALMFVLLHLGLLVYSQLTTAIDPISFRLLSPAVIPALIVIAWSSRRLSQKMRYPGVQWAACSAAIILVFGYTVLSARWIGDPPWTYWGSGAYGLSATDVPEYCLEPGRSVFTNSPVYLRYIGVSSNVKWLPRRKIWRANKRHDDWEKFARALELGDACLVWLGRAGRDAPSHRDLLGGEPGSVTIQFLSKKNSAFFFRATINRDDG